MKIRYMSVDIESYSSVDLKKCGVYKYAESPDAELLLFGYSVNGGEVRVIDVANGEKIPENILAALIDETVMKWAFSASFERVFLSLWLERNFPKMFCSYSMDEDTVGSYLNPESWRCSKVWCAYMGLPLSLKEAGAVLGLDKQKLTEGADLIRYFCKPCKPSKANQMRTRNLPCHAPEKWSIFKAYNKRDVETEMEIQRKLKRFPVPDFVWEEYKLDQEINDRGIAIDMELAQNAISFDEACKTQLLAQLKERTGLENPNSVQQMIQWLEEKGLQTNSLDKKAVDALLKDASTEVAEVLEMRKQLAKSSVSKYYAMKEVVCSDNRARGMFQFYGASRSGRWAGRMIQLQNLPQNHLECLDAARSILKSGDYEQMQMRYENIPDTLSQLIRTAFVPRSGYKFVVADFSSIEARVLSFLAGEQWRLDVFESGRDIYCMSASQMFHVPVEKHGVNGHLRQKGKIAELACIAEGQLVLTNHGLLPIEKVSLSDKVWDGENWVSHDGVVYRGEREVLTYEGLTATPDHFVWIEGKSQPIQFGLAAASGAHLVQTGDCGAQKNYQRTAKLYDIRNAGPNHRFTVSGKLVHNCGYGGSVGALKAMGALDMGLQEEELQPLVTAWRNSNPNIVRFWWDVDRAVTETVKKHASTETHGIQFSYKSGMLFITLPSGRNLVYVRPRIGQNRFGGACVTYEGIGTNKKWVRIDSYGPKFVENLVQGISRDILCYAMRTLSSSFICAHVHDELIIECRKDVSVDAICEQMGRTPPWIQGLNLRADGFESMWYKKE